MFMYQLAVLYTIIAIVHAVIVMKSEVKVVEN